jgi:ribonuclease P protein component
VRTAVIDVRASASLRASARVGVVVPRYKQSCVARNQLKRRLKELIRLEWLPLLPPMDLVLRVTPPAYDRDFATLQAEMRQLLPKLLKAWPTV